MRQVALQRSVSQRGKFMADISFFNVTQFVFADVVGCDRRDNIRKFGYSLRGETPVYCRNFQRGECVSVILLLCPMRDCWHVNT